MAHSELNLAYKNGEKLFGNIWTSEAEKKKGTVVLVHGMAEYSFRYDEMARFLNENGYDVYAEDHIGHGKAVSQDPNAYYKYGMWPEDGFDQTIERIDFLVRYVHSLSDKPVFVYGHSLGSFLVTGYYERHSENAKAYIICGSAYNNGTYKMSSKLTSLMKAFESKKKRDKEAKFLINVSNKTMNKKEEPFKDGYTSDFLWLSYNEENVRKYDLDKECGFPCSFNFYYSMFHGQQKIWNKKALNGIKEKKPLFIIGGQDDPVGGYGKDVENLGKFFKGYQDKVTVKLYPHMKHEIHNELNHKEVFNDILAFLDANL